MSDDERVLRSFVSDDEEWLDCRTVTAAKRSKGQLPPAGGEETIAVTDERLLWFNDELEEVPLADVEETELEYVERQAAPPMVLGGGLLFVLGIFASIGAFLADVGDTFVVAMPVLTGLAVFLATRVIASLTGREGETRAGHRLRLWVDDAPVSIWGAEEAAMEAIRTAIATDRDAERAAAASDAGTASVEDEDTLADDEDTAEEADPA